jgi:hypothetical protein
MKSSEVCATENSQVNALTVGLENSIVAQNWEYILNVGSFLESIDVRLFQATKSSYSFDKTIAI